MTEISQDPDKARQFAENLLSTLNAGATCLMISVGHRTGLFDALSKTEAASSSELAERADLNERYVREWLGAMVTSRIVEFNADTGKYSLPPEHACALTRDSAPNNMAVFAQYVPLLGAVEDDIVHCFREGGGVPYSRFTRFHEVMAEDSGQTVLPTLFNHILPLVPGLIEKLESGIQVLDVGCGSGRALNLMASRFPRSEFTGIDLSEDAIRSGKEMARTYRLTNLKFIAKDLSTFDRQAEPESYDLVTTFDAVHDQGQPLAVLKGIARTLRADGVYLMQDINGSSHVENNLRHPIGPFLYTVSCMHCMTVSLAQEGAGLGAMWGREKAFELLKEAGFKEVKVHELEHDVQNCYYVISK